jgi:hypothetical protein
MGVTGLLFMFGDPVKENDSDENKAEIWFSYNINNFNYVK